MARIIFDQVSFAYPLLSEMQSSLRTGLLRCLGVLPKPIAGRSAPREVRAINDVSFDLSPGDRLAVLGPNGSGKTTLLKLIASIYVPDRGTISVDGEVYPMLAMGFGMDMDATGLENVYLMGYLRRRSRADSDRLIDTIAEISELGEALHRPVYSYSSGMMARLAFAITICTRPDILVVDEFIGTGDAKFREKSSAMVQDVFSGSGILVFASHSRAWVERLCNKAILLRNGAVAAAGDIATVFAAQGKLGM